MRRRSRLLSAVVACALASAVMVSGVGSADPSSGVVTVPKAVERKSRLHRPEDRYAMAGGCYAVRSRSGYVVRQGTGFAATGTRLKAAEPFRFQATDLGRYLLFDSHEDFLAASEGRLAEVVYGVTRSDAGGTVGGATGERTDHAADEVAKSEANEASGRGASVVAAAAPSDLADWEIDVAAGGFTVVLPATDQALAATRGGDLELVARSEAGTFRIELRDGCAAYPEIEINIEGPVMGGANDFQEVRGFMDLHLHMMAFEFLGGRARCGRPWHRFGVAHALVDCPDHEPGGHGALLEAFLSGGDPVTGHNTDGWPTFVGWPKANSLTHEQIYYKWLERAWRGGFRLFTNLLVDNNQLCKIYPYKRNSCNEMDGVRLQHRRIHELQDYIDAQSGGPGEGWFRIVEDPFEAREVINEGRLAVVLGIEVSVPLDCGLRLDDPQCDARQVNERLDQVHELGVRQMELVNKFDNALSGVTGDAGSLGVVVNSGNFMETGRYWRMDTCSEPEGHLYPHGDHFHEGHAHDKQQLNVHDGSGFPDEITGRDALVGGILALAGTSGAAPVYPEGPHCNQLGLSDLGEQMIRGMVDRKMIFDPDHMSATGRLEAMDLIDELGYSGVVSSHGWADEIVYPRIYEAGGVITPHGGGSSSFVEKWRQHREWADDRFYFGFGTGADTNGFSAQGGPRGADAENPVAYPFAGFGGVTVDKQRSGTRTYDVNTDGLAHFGLYPDWIEDLRRQAGEEIIEDLVRGPEAYLQMWERAVGIAPNACRSDVLDITDEEIASLRSGMTPREVLEHLGQPDTRTGFEFTYCMSDGRRATLGFSRRGALKRWYVGSP